MPKISALPPAGTLADDDETPFVDNSASTTKKFTFTGLKTYLQSLVGWISTAMIADGAVTPVKMDLEIASAEVTTAQTTTSATMGDLSTPGPSVTVTVGASGMLLVTVSGHLQNSTATGRSEMSYEFSGANTLSANTNNHGISLIAVSAGVAQSASYTYLHTGLNPGSTTVTAKYARNVGGTSTFTQRRLMAWAI